MAFAQDLASGGSALSPLGRSAGGSVPLESLASLASEAPGSSLAKPFRAAAEEGSFSMMPLGAVERSRRPAHGAGSSPHNKAAAPPVGHRSAIFAV
jgi:hypothetical protein